MTARCGLVPQSLTLRIGSAPVGPCAEPSGHGITVHRDAHGRCWTSAAVDYAELIREVTRLRSEVAQLQGERARVDTGSPAPADFPWADPRYDVLADLVHARKDAEVHALQPPVAEQPHHGQKIPDRNRALNVLAGDLSELYDWLPLTTRYAAAHEALAVVEVQLGLPVGEDPFRSSTNGHTAADDPVPATAPERR